MWPPTWVSTRCLPPSTIRLPNRGSGSTRGLGTMGFGLPAAMGPSLPNPDAVVACVTGDGSIQMNIQELSTCLQYGLPVKIITMNNRALGMVKQWQKMFYGGATATPTWNPAGLRQAGGAYGHVGIR